MVWDDEGLWFSLIVATAGCTALFLVALRIVGFPPSLVFARILRPNHVTMDPATGQMVMVTKAMLCDQTDASGKVEDGVVSSSLFSLFPFRRLLRLGEEGYEGEDTEDISMGGGSCGDKRQQQQQKARRSHSKGPTGDSGSSLDTTGTPPASALNAATKFAPSESGDTPLLTAAAASASAGGALVHPPPPPADAMLTQDPKVDTFIYMLKLGFVLLFLGVGTSTIGIAALSATDDYLSVYYYSMDTFKCREISNSTSCEGNVHCEWTWTGHHADVTTTTPLPTSTAAPVPTSSSAVPPLLAGDLLLLGHHKNHHETAAAPYTLPAPPAGESDEYVSPLHFLYSLFSSKGWFEPRHHRQTAASTAGNAAGPLLLGNASDDSGFCSPIPTKGLYDLSIQNIAPNPDSSSANMAEDGMIAGDGWRWYVVAALASLFAVLYGIVMCKVVNNSQRYVKRVMRLQSRHALGYRTVLLRNVPEHIAKDEALFKKLFLSVEGLATPVSLLSVMGKLRRHLTTPLVARIGTVERGPATNRNMIGVAASPNDSNGDSISSPTANNHANNAAAGCVGGSNPYHMSELLVTVQRPVMKGLLHFGVEVPADSLRLFSKGITREEVGISSSSSPSEKKEKKEHAAARGPAQSASTASALQQQPQNPNDGASAATATATAPAAAVAAAAPSPSLEAAAARYNSVLSDLPQSGQSMQMLTSSGRPTHDDGGEEEEGEGEKAVIGDGNDKKKATEIPRHLRTTMPPESMSGAAAGKQQLKKKGSSSREDDYSDADGEGDSLLGNKNNTANTDDSAADIGFDTMADVDAILTSLRTVSTLSAAVTTVPCRTVPLGAELALAKYQSSLLALQDAVAREHRYHAKLLAKRRAALEKELAKRERAYLRKHSSSGGGGDGESRAKMRLLREGGSGDYSSSDDDAGRPRRRNGNNTGSQSRDASPNAPTAAPSPEREAASEVRHDASDEDDGTDAPVTRDTSEFFTDKMTMGGEGENTKKAVMNGNVKQNNKPNQQQQQGQGSFVPLSPAAGSVAVGIPPSPPMLPLAEEDVHNGSTSRKKRDSGLSAGTATTAASTMQQQQQQQMTLAEEQRRKERRLFSADERAERAAVLAAPLPPLTTRSMGLVGSKMEEVGYYKDAYRMAAHELSDLLASLRAEGRYNGAVFVVFEDAACAVEYCDVVTSRFATGVGKGVSYTPVTAAIAGPPDELHRSSLNINTIAARTFFIVSMCFFVWLVFFYSIPIAALSSFSSLARLPYGIGDWLQAHIISQMSVTVRGTVQAYLPVIVLALFNLILPIYVRATVISSGSANKEETNKWQSLLMFLFSFLTTVLFQAVLQGGFEQLAAIMENPQWATISTMLVAMVSPSGGYWYALVIGSFIGTWLMAINVWHLIKALLFGGSAASQHEYDHQFRRSTPATQLLFPNALVMLGIGVLFHATVPILSFACGVFFLFAYMAARGVFLDTYRSPLHNTRQRVSSFGMLRYGLRCVSVLYCLAAIGLVLAFSVKQVWWPMVIVAVITLPVAFVTVGNVFASSALWEPNALLFRAWAEEDEACGLNFGAKVLGIELRSASASPPPANTINSGAMSGAGGSAATSANASPLARGGGGGYVFDLNAVGGGSQLPFRLDDDGDGDEDGPLPKKSGLGGGGYRDTLPPGAQQNNNDEDDESEEDSPAPAEIILGEEGGGEREDVAHGGPSLLKGQRMLITKRGGGGQRRDGGGSPSPAAVGTAVSMSLSRPTSPSQHHYQHHLAAAEASVYIPDRSFFVDAGSVFTAFDMSLDDAEPSPLMAGGREGGGFNAGDDDDDEDGPAPILLLDGALERNDAVVMAFNQSRRMQIDKLDDDASVCYSVGRASRASHGTTMGRSRRGGAVGVAGTASSMGSQSPYNARLASLRGTNATVMSRMSSGLRPSVAAADDMGGGDASPYFGISNPNYISGSAVHRSGAGIGGAEGMMTSVTRFREGGGGGDGPAVDAMGLAANIIISPFWRYKFMHLVDKPWDYHAKIERLILAASAAGNNTAANGGASRFDGAGAGPYCYANVSSAAAGTTAVPIPPPSATDGAPHQPSSYEAQRRAANSFIDVDGQIEAACNGNYTIARYWHGDAVEDALYSAVYPHRSNYDYDGEDPSPAEVVLLGGSGSEEAGNATRVDEGRRGLGIASSSFAAAAAPRRSNASPYANGSLALSTTGSMGRSAIFTANFSGGGMASTRASNVGGGYAYVYDSRSSAAAGGANASRASNRRVIYIREGAGTPTMLSRSNFNASGMTAAAAANSVLVTNSGGGRASKGATPIANHLTPTRASAAGVGGRDGQAVTPSQRAAYLQRHHSNM